MFVQLALNVSVVQLALNVSGICANAADTAVDKIRPEVLKKIALKTAASLQRLGVHDHLLESNLPDHTILVSLLNLD